MTTQQQIDKLTHIASVALKSIQCLERATAASVESIQGLERTAARREKQIATLEPNGIKIDERIAKLLQAQELTNLSVRALADEIINTQREWQGYLRRIHPQ